jgi:hypothetical protein
MAELDSITKMPKLPVTSSLKAAIPAAPKGRVGPKEIAPATEELDTEIAKAQKQVGEADINIEKAKREEKARELETQAKGLEKFSQDVEQMPERLALKEIRQQQQGMEFIPTKDTAKDIAGLFSLISVVGMVLGKSNAQGAMSAMNGMLDGYQKGRQDLFKKEATEFDKNFKAMQTKVSSALAEFQEALKIRQTDKEAGQLREQAALSRMESPLLKAIYEKQGPAAVVQRLQEIKKSTTQDMPKMINDLQAKSDELRLKEEKAELSRQLAELKASGSGKATQQQFIAQRSVNALGGVASAVEALSQLPAGSTVGILGNLTTKDGMVNYMRNAAARTMAPSEAKAVETLFTGITRNLAAIEASGAATGLTGLASQLEKLRPVAGDKAVDVALKMADIRRIATENIQPLIDSGLMPKQQTDTAAALVKRIESAIPYTTDEVVKAAYKGKGKETMGEAGARVAAPKVAETYSDPEKERRYQEYLRNNP